MLLTDEQCERRDNVDVSCHMLIEELVPDGVEVDWDSEDIGRIRDVVQDIIVNKLKQYCTEAEFYPEGEEPLWEGEYEL